MTSNDEIHLTRNEQIVLLAIYTAQKNGETPPDDDALVERTGLSLEEVTAATQFLHQRVQFISSAPPSEDNKS